MKYSKLLFRALLLFMGMLSLAYDNSTLAEFTPPFKYVLKNGLTVLVKKVENNLPVAVQVWYKAGSKDESYRGDAHLLEHLLFAGTQRMSEKDVPLIANKFSGDVNAMTWYDFTCMLFNLPKAHWQISIPVLADCMTNCTLRQQVLNSELKAVIQELKMRRDDTNRVLLLALLQNIFPSYHPYHHPVIGYKHDLYKANSERLREFYKKYYVPNNAVLVVVGNVDENEVVRLAEQNFGSISAKPVERNPIPFVQDTIQSKSTKLYRDIEKPVLAVAFKIPGALHMPPFVGDLLHVMLTKGKSSRLYKKLVEELKLVSHVSSGNYGFIESDVFMIETDPLHANSADKVVTCIKQELEKILKEGPTAEEIKRFKALITTNSLQLLENNYEHAIKIGHFYTAFNDESKIYTTLNGEQVPKDIVDQVKQFVATYLRSSALFEAVALPFDCEADKEIWKRLQVESDLEDTKILTTMQRTLPLEEGKYVHELELSEEVLNFVDISVEEFTLKNGLKVVYHKRTDSPLIYCSTQLRSSQSQEAHEQRDALFCLDKLLQKSGTKKYSNIELSDLLTLLNFKGTNRLGLLSGHFPAKNFNEIAELIIEMASNAILDQTKLVQIINEAEVNAKEHRNQPSYKQVYHLNKALYGTGHPLGSDPAPDMGLIKKLTIDDLQRLYEKFIIPQEVTVILVGNIPISENSSVQEVLESAFGRWQDKSTGDFKPLEYPKAEIPSSSTLSLTSLRDQVSLAYGTLSIDANHPDYCALALYNVHLNERLFHLREETGAFYVIKGDMLVHASKKKQGKAYITTMVSPDRLSEVKALLQDFIVKDIQNFDEQNLKKAKATRKEQYRLMIETPKNILKALDYIINENESYDFFTKKLKRFESVTLEDVKRVVSKIFKPEHMVTVQVGRVDDEGCEKITKAD